MSESEHCDYVRISDPVATYAFYTHPSGVSLLNLRWLSELVHQYEASHQQRADIQTERDRIELMREIVRQVDDDHMAWFVRQRPEEGGRGAEAAP